MDALCMIPRAIQETRGPARTAAILAALDDFSRPASLQNPPPNECGITALMNCCDDKHVILNPVEDRVWKLTERRAPNVFHVERVHVRTVTEPVDDFKQTSEEHAAQSSTLSLVVRGSITNVDLGREGEPYRLRQVWGRPVADASSVI